MNTKLLYRLARNLRFYKKDLIIVIISLLSVSLALLLIGNVFRNLVDQGLVLDRTAAVDKSILYICLLIIILSIASFFRSYFINNVAEKVSSQIRKEAYSNLINYEITEFEELKIGDIISRLTSDIDQISKLIVNFLSFFIRNSVMLVGSIILMFFESFKLASIVIITIPLLLIPIIKFGKHVKALSKKTLESQSLLASDINESFSNIKTIHAFGGQAAKITEFNNLLQDYLTYSAARLKIRALFFAFSMAFIFLGVTLVIWIGALDIVKGNLSSGQIISFIYYAIIAGFSSGGIFELLSEMHLPLAALERIVTIIDKSPIVHNNYSDLKPVNSISLEFKNVNFSYPSRPNLKILNNISFKIDSTQFIGIVGRSGSGKSTLMQLLLRFYVQESGIILVNNQDIALLNPNEIRKLIAYVPQEASIFSGTIKSNIMFGNDSSEEEITEIIKITGIADFTDKIPDGINAKIGEKGVRLSGGQKQRIALARALLRKPQILLLDEAMNALDSQSEQKLLSSIRDIMKGKIVISIAHRISSIESADNILIIDKGAVEAEGTHAHLLKTSDLYRTIYKEVDLL
ncbi:ABC transporter ATP-binding protein [Rickettsia bellii]|uniref:Putative export ATP-binding/permease protein RBE_0492 n=2 Tax=Rickettsia bellii TaxID=33990 RepID=Y492_RICBR|nr:ABC transporter transmembrane domain-containing protein [Rickettsia bellii]Q1RJ91.1 RecName: Full=Putative export ATP-binding/permease protein RBE_0492 [Rickettsia bellii RML369-C]ABE04573.1 Multidrug resistance protein [Rickettsia bellii RML369-C]ABV78940.1 Multidrug resistance protein [Rickettsia bellii OSU 85-389]KJV91615.1 ABC transporter family protein [Rickettsia bellii str. RML Mogi]